MPGNIRLFYKKNNADDNKGFEFYCYENGEWKQISEWYAEKPTSYEAEASAVFTPVSRVPVSAETAAELNNRYTGNLAGSNDDSTNFGELKLLDNGKFDISAFSQITNIADNTNTNVKENASKMLDNMYAHSKFSEELQQEFNEQYINTGSEEASEETIRKDMVSKYFDRISSAEAESDFKLAQERAYHLYRQNEAFEALEKNRDVLKLESRMDRNTDDSKSAELARKMTRSLMSDSLKVYMPDADPDTGEVKDTLRRLSELGAGEQYKGGELEIGFGSDMFARFLSEEDRKLLLKGEAENPESPYEELIRSIYPDDEARADLAAKDIKDFSKGISDALLKFQSGFYKSLNKDDPTSDVKDGLTELLSDLSELSNQHGRLFALLQADDDRTRKIAAAALMSAWELSMADYRKRINKEIRELNPEQLRKLAIMDRNITKENLQQITGTLKGMFLSDNFETLFGTMLLSMANPLFAAIVAAPFLVFALVALTKWMEAKDAEKTADIHEARMREHINVMSKVATGQALYIDVVKGGLFGRINDVLEQAATPEGVASYSIKGQALRAALEPIMMANFEKDITVGSQEDMQLRQSLAYVYGKFFESTGALTPEFVQKMNTLKERIMAETVLDIDGNVKDIYAEHKDIIADVFSMDDKNSLTDDLRKTLTDYKKCLGDISEFEKTEEKNINDILYGIVPEESLNDPEFCKRLAGLIRKYKAPGVDSVTAGPSYGAYTTPNAVARCALNLLDPSRDEFGETQQDYDNKPEYEIKGSHTNFGNEKDKITGQRPSDGSKEYLEAQEKGTVIKYQTNPERLEAYGRRSYKSRDSVLADLGLRFMVGSVPTRNVLEKWKGDFGQQMSYLNGMGLVQQVLEAKAYNPENPDPNIDASRNIFLLNGKQNILKENGAVQLLMQIGVLESLNEQMLKTNGITFGEMDTNEKITEMNAAKALVAHQCLRTFLAIKDVRLKNPQLYNKVRELCKGSNKELLLDDNFKDLKHTAQIEEALWQYYDEANKYYGSLDGVKERDVESLIIAGSETSFSAAAREAVYGVIGGKEMENKIELIAEERRAAEEKLPNEAARDEEAEETLRKWEEEMDAAENDFDSRE